MGDSVASDNSWIYILVSAGSFAVLLCVCLFCLMWKEKKKGASVQPMPPQRVEREMSIQMNNGEVNSKDAKFVGDDEDEYSDHQREGQQNALQMDSSEAQADGHTAGNVDDEFEVRGGDEEV